MPALGKFSKAIADMGSDKSTERRHWGTDQKEQGVDDRRPADSISVQHYGHLDRELKEQNVMVFRLGTGHYGLVKVPNVDVFFLDEQDPDLVPKLFEPDLEVEDILPYRVIGPHIEANAVNLALATGLFAQALHAEVLPRHSPAMGNSTYDFDVRPHHKLLDLSWKHSSGQVELDSLVLGKRNNRYVLFVIEAKSGSGAAPRLAKHKLTYAVEAVLGNKLMKDLCSLIDIVPVYVYANSENQSAIEYLFVECEYPAYEDNKRFVSSLTAVRTSKFVLSLPSDEEILALLENMEK